MFRSFVSTNSKTGASCAVTGNVSCSKELSKDTSTSGFEKMSRLEWVAGLGIMCAAVVVIVLRIRTNVIDRQGKFWKMSIFLRF